MTWEITVENIFVRMSADEGGRVYVYWEDLKYNEAHQFSAVSATCLRDCAFFIRIGYWPSQTA